MHRVSLTIQRQVDDNNAVVQPVLHFWHIITRCGKLDALQRSRGRMKATKMEVRRIYQLIGSKMNMLNRSNPLFNIDLIKGPIRFIFGT